MYVHIYSYVHMYTYVYIYIQIHDPIYEHTRKRNEELSLARTVARHSCCAQQMYMNVSLYTYFFICSLSAYGIYIHMSIYVFVCMYTYTRIQTYINKHVHTLSHTHTHAHTHMHINLFMYTSAYIAARGRTFARVIALHTHTRTQEKRISTRHSLHIHTHTHTHTHVHTYTFTRTYTYVVAHDVVRTSHAHTHARGENTYTYIAAPRCIYMYNPYITAFYAHLTRTHTHERRESDRRVWHIHVYLRCVAYTYIAAFRQHLPHARRKKESDHGARHSSSKCMTRKKTPRHARRRVLPPPQPKVEVKILKSQLASKCTI